MVLWFKKKKKKQKKNKGGMPAPEDRKGRRRQLKRVGAYSLCCVPGGTGLVFLSGRLEQEVIMNVEFMETW